MPKPQYVEITIPTLKHSLVGYDLVSETRDGASTRLFFKRREAERRAAAAAPAKRKKRKSVDPAAVIVDALTAEASRG